MFPVRFLAALAIWLGLLLSQPALGGDAPRNIILFIGDGMGMNHVQAGSLRKACNEQRDPVESRLAFEEFPITGYLTTDSASGPVTDSAAAGTALACGVKTQNGVIGKGPDGKDVDSIAAVAKKRGKAVGIVTSVALDDATPACFYAHAASRGDTGKILEQAFASPDFDVLMGGGVLAKGWSGDTLATKCESSDMYYLSAKGLEAFTPASAGQRRVFGYFDLNGNTLLDPMATRNAADPEPRLTAITRKALKILISRADSSGLFMMVEGGAIDKVSHAGDTAAMIGEVLELNQTVADVVALLKEKGMFENTLLVVTADHETGGLVLAENALLNKIAKTGAKWPDGSAVAVPAPCKIGKVKLGWTVGDHTCTWVPVFASGPQSPRFAGRHDNTDVAKIIRELVTQE